MAMRLLSRRFEELIFNKKLTLSIPRRVRQRFWFLLEKRNESWYYHPNHGDDWTETTDVLTETKSKLLDQYGIEKLEAFNEKDERVVVDLEGFVKGGYPSQVFDTIECAFEQLPDTTKLLFQREINELLDDEEINWRFADGQFFKVDKSLLTKDILIEASEHLQTHGFEGALEEFREARKDFSAQDYKGAINNANKALESVIKTILGDRNGNASSLIRDLVESPLFQELPEGFGKAFGSQVLMSVPFIRNRLGGHGQGANIVSVPKELAELTLNLTGSKILFLIKFMLTSKQEESQTQQLDVDDDLPF